ncbi:MAG: AbrB/MazE/SpoVT family DNA-binding domain-containing protein [Candidatus Gracilibacteria bacterium]
MNYTLKLFNTGQVTLPKKWREKYSTEHFTAEETVDGLLIRPLIVDEEQDVVYYENKEGFGIYSNKGLDATKILEEITKLHGQD